MLFRNSFKSKIQFHPFLLMILLLIFCSTVIMRLSAHAEGGVTGGGGAIDMTCYFIDQEGLLTTNEVSRDKICKEPEIMIKACSIISGTDDCTGMPGSRLRDVLSYH